MPNIAPKTYEVNRDTLLLDYSFSLPPSTRLDAVSMSLGVDHPMLNGSTRVELILESLTSHGFLSSASNTLISLPLRKRDIIAALPVVSLTAQVGNFYVPPDSDVYTDDGITRGYPRADGGRINIEVRGGVPYAPATQARNGDGSSGMQRSLSNASTMSDNSLENENGGRMGRSASKEGRKEKEKIVEGIMVKADFGALFEFLSETIVSEFPELEIFEDQKVFLSCQGSASGSMHFHLVPPFNSHSQSPSENQYHIHFSDSNFSLTVDNSSISLSHRRVLIPSGTTITANVVKSVVDMALDGITSCEVAWDFQGASPVLQVTELGDTPLTTDFEKKKTAEILLPALRQGRLNLNVSQVGGVHITKAKTGRERKEGMFDWKFFNALVNPDADNTQKLLDVLHHRPTMNKMIEIVELINPELHDIAKYILTQLWRAKDILDSEGVSDPKHVIPGGKMGRLVSLLVSGDLSVVDECTSVVAGVTSGEGLDTLALKEILRNHLNLYDEYAAEIDRAVKWAALMLNPVMDPPQNFVETDVKPLSEITYNRKLFKTIPSAKAIYNIVDRDKQIPLSISFSNSISRVVPYLSLKQVRYLLESRRDEDWQPRDLRRLRYISSVKKKVLEISESYGGLSFLPQSFLVSVFVGEATRGSLRARPNSEDMGASGFMPSPAGRIASYNDLSGISSPKAHRYTNSDFDPTPLEGDETDEEDVYELGDSLLGPSDVAILLQAGLTSPLKASTVVQLNQRMLLDLVASQPRSFAIAVLAEIGNPGGHGSARVLAGALMALLETNQESFSSAHKLDMGVLLESWLGISIPRREQYMAGGRWARQSYYEAIYRVAMNVLEDAETYLALKGYLQRRRDCTEEESIPLSPLLVAEGGEGTGCTDAAEAKEKIMGAKGIPNLSQSLKDFSCNAIELIKEADRLAMAWMDGRGAGVGREEAVKAYEAAFKACREVLEADKLAFQCSWFKKFYTRNYDALMVLNVYENVRDDVDKVREWMDVLNAGAMRAEAAASEEGKSVSPGTPPSSPARARLKSNEGMAQVNEIVSTYFKNFGNNNDDRVTVEKIIEAIFFDPAEKEDLKNDPLCFLLLENPDGDYNFTIISAMGVITEGKKGTEMAEAYERLKTKRGVDTIRADTATARSFEYNASKIEEAIAESETPFGFVGYSQGCANSLTAESLMNSGTPKQRKMLDGLVCRQLLYSAANGSMHGSCSDKKAQKLIIMGEEAFKYHQGYFSKAFISSVLTSLNEFMDSSAFQKFLGGAQSMLPEGCKAFWREAQHKVDVPTVTIRGIMENHTTPERWGGATTAYCIALH